MASEDADQLASDRHLIDAPDLIWHYTDSAGLIGILSNRGIWATQVGHLNDRSELEHAFGLAKAAMPRIDMGPEDTFLMTRILEEVVFDATGARVFVACFCVDGDLLSQWRGYANNDGFAVGFDPESVARATCSVDVASNLGPTDYDRSNAERAAESWVREAVGHWNDAHPTRIYQEIFGGIDKGLDAGPLAVGLARRTADFVRNVAGFAALAALYKDPAFREEQEWRLVVNLAPTVSACQGLCFRPSHRGVIPYLEMRLPQEGSTSSPSRWAAPKGPVRAVRIGPGLDPVAQTSAVRLLLQRYGYADSVEVVTSAIPFRS